MMKRQLILTLVLLTIAIGSGIGVFVFESTTLIYRVCATSLYAVGLIAWYIVAVQPSIKRETSYEPNSSKKQ